MDDQVVKLLQDQYDLMIVQHSELIQLIKDNHALSMQAQGESVTYLVSFMAGLVFAALLTYLLDRGVIK